MAPTAETDEFPDLVERIAATALAADMRTCRRPRSGSVADTYLLAFEDAAPTRQPDRAVCKLGGASVWTDDVIEPLVVEHIGDGTELPVPDVLASGSLADGAFDATVDRWVLYDYLDGRNPAPEYIDLDPAVRRRLVVDAGTHLGRLHAASIDATPADVLGFDRVGGLECTPSGDDIQVCDPDGWYAVDPDLPLDSLPVPLAGDPDCAPVLTHGDFQPSNLLIASDGSVTGVLDWGNAHVTHAEYAVARAEIRFVDVYAGRLSHAERDRLRRTFRDAYARNAPLEDAYPRHATWYKLLWLAQSGANYARIVRHGRGRQQVWRQFRRVLGRSGAV